MNKIIIGIDFDNTIVDYKNLFSKVAKTKNFIKRENLNKTELKQFLIKNFHENEWTKIQGEVYGKTIFEAKPYKNFLNSISHLNNNKFEKLIISHKTKYPILGKKYNLQKSAIKWLKNNNILSSKTGLKKSRVFFNESIENKIRTIKKFKCNYFIDDMKFILSLLPNKIEKILFDPYKLEKNSSKYILIHNWNDINKIFK